MSTSVGKRLSLLGAIFCFVAFLISALGYFSNTAGQLDFASIGERQIVNTMFWFGSAFLIAFGIKFLQDSEKTT